MSERDDQHDTCGCCAAVESPSVYNPPGAASLRYRIDTHAGFFNRMLAALPEQPSLSRLTTHDPGDPSIALLDSWAVLGDILTFYQERIANEGFLGTSTERRSIHELAAMIGYQLKPGVAASTYLAFTMESPIVVPSTTPGATPPNSVNTPATVEIAAGTKVNSSPGPGEQPQTFETTEAVTARIAWNSIKVRQTMRQQLGVEGGLVTWRKLSDGTVASATAAQYIWLSTASSNLVAGDWIVVEVVAAKHRVLHDPVSASCKEGFLAVRVKSVEVDTTAGTTKVELLQTAGQPPPFPELPDFPDAAVSTTTATLTAAYVKSDIIQKTWSEPELAAQTEAQRWDEDRLLASVAAVLAAEPAPALVWALRQQAAPFGAVAPPYATLTTEVKALYGNKDWDGTSPPSVWTNSQGTNYSGADIFLDRVVDGLAPGGWVVFNQPDTATEFYRITAVVERSLSDYATSGKVTGLKLDLRGGSKNTAWKFRTTTFRVLSQSLPVGTAPLTTWPVGGANQKFLVAEKMVLGLEGGQVLAISGEALDEDKTSLGTRTELAVLDRVEHTTGRSVLYLDEPLANVYTRATFAVCANLAPATHGETIPEEPMGSADGSAHQARVLRRPPLTLVPAETASGTASTLTVRVNGVAWDEVSTLLDADPADRVFQTRTSDDGKTTVTFGDGVHGARPPTGRDNLAATYRTGMGLGGNVEANKLTLLASRPLGLRGVTNPEAASGAEDPEDVEQARGNAPLAVRTLDRVVSLADYQDFARGFAGIAKARGVSLWDGNGRLVHLTIAGFDNEPVSKVSKLYKNLVGAIARQSDGIERVFVDSHTPRTFALEATVTVRRSHVKEDVEAACIDVLTTAYSFDERELAAPVTEADVMKRLIAIDGVISVKVTKLYRLDQAVAANAVIVAADARWDEATRTVAPAELLTLVPANLRLTTVYP